MFWWLLSRAFFFGIIATFDLNRVSPAATAAVRSTVGMSVAIVQRIRIAIKGESNAELEVPNTMIIVERDTLEVMMDVFGHLSLYQAACVTIAVPKKLMSNPLVAAASSILNCCIVSQRTKDAPSVLHVSIVPRCDETEQYITDFKGHKVKASRTSGSKLYFTEIESDLSDEVETVN